MQTNSNDGLALFSFCFLIGCLGIGLSLQQIDIDVIYKHCGTEKPMIVLEKRL